MNDVRQDQIIEIVTNEPGITPYAVALRIGPYESSGYRAVWSVVKKGRIRKAPREGDQGGYRLYPVDTVYCPTCGSAIGED